MTDSKHSSNASKVSRNIVIASGLWDRPGPFCSYLESLRTKQDFVPIEPDIEHALCRLKSVQLENASELSFYHSQSQLFATAINGLKACWHLKILAIERLDDMGKAFQAELRKKHPMAKLILAHWGASLHGYDHLWWATGIGKQIVECATDGLDSSFSGASLDFLYIISWPRKRVGIDTG